MKIAIASGKGGTGKTFVATNIFFTLQKHNYSAALVDCDAEEPNSVAFFKARQIRQTEVTQQVPVVNTDICTFCGKCNEYCNYNAIFIVPQMKIIKVMEDLCHSCGACTVACSFKAISEKSVSRGTVITYSNNGKPSLIEARMNVGVMSPVPMIKEAIKQADDMAEIIIMDSPPGTSCPFIQTVATADYVVLVTEPTPFGLSDLKQSVETLKKINKPYGVIINRVGLGNKSVQEYIEHEGIAHLFDIPFSKNIAELYSVGRIVSETDPHLAGQMLGLIENISLQYGNSNNQR